MQTVIKVHIKCMKQGKATINCYDGKITITYNQIEVTCPMSLDDLKVFSLNYPAGINLFDDLEKEISYTNAKIEEKPVKLNTNGAHVLSYRCNHKENNVNEISWTLSDISYSYQSDMENNYYILDIPFIYLTVKLDDIYKFPNNIIVENDRHKFLFLQSDNENQTILRVENCSDDNINDLLIHMDFYFHTLVNVSEKHIYYNGKENVTVHIPHFKSKEETLRHPELQFISIGNPNTFKTFIQKSQWKSLNINDRNKLRQAIYTFARCKYCDDTTQFLLLYSILDRYVGNSHGEKPYHAMGKKLLKRKIAISKIGQQTDKEIQKLHLRLIHDNEETVEVTNFCNLRNYIMHFMATSEIDEFLKHSVLVANMRFAVTTIILQEFGFNSFQFHDGWNHLSVFDEKE